jgi:hypothetical protein
MQSIASEFPQKHAIWSGAILGSIAHAIAVSRYPSFANEQSWDGTNYSVQDSAGSRGTIAFSDDRLVGVFFLDSSNRNPFHSKLPYDIDRFFRGMPQSLNSLAQKEALQYVLQEVNDAVVPVITCAFWADEKSDTLFAAESWPDVIKHGASLIYNQLLDSQKSLLAWQADYELTQIETNLIQSLYYRKLAHPSAIIYLDPLMRVLLEKNSAGQQGIEACQVSLSEIGIML